MLRFIGCLSFLLAWSSAFAQKQSITPQSVLVIKPVIVINNDSLNQDTLAKFAPNTALYNCNCPNNEIWCTIKLENDKIGKIRRTNLAFFKHSITHSFSDKFQFWTAYQQDKDDAYTHFLVTLANGLTNRIATSHHSEYGGASWIRIDSILDIMGDGHPEIIINDRHDYEEGIAEETYISICSVLSDTTTMIFEKKLYSWHSDLETAAFEQCYISIKNRQIIAEYIKQEDCNNLNYCDSIGNQCLFHYTTTYTWNASTNTYSSKHSKKSPQITLSKGSLVYQKSTSNYFISRVIGIVRKKQDATVLQLTSLSNYSHRYPLYIQTTDGFKGYIPLHNYQFQHHEFDWFQHSRWEDFVNYKLP